MEKIMGLLKAYKWTKEDIIAFALYSTKLTIDIFEKKYPEEKRPRRALEAIKLWLKKPTEENRIIANFSCLSAYSYSNWFITSYEIEYAVTSAIKFAWYAAESTSFYFSPTITSLFASKCAEFALYISNDTFNKTKNKLENWLINHISKMERINTYDKE